MATVDAMRVANTELKRQYGKVDLDKIDVRELISYSHLPHSKLRTFEWDGRIDSILNFRPYTTKWKT